MSGRIATVGTCGCGGRTSYAVWCGPAPLANQPDPIGHEAVASGPVGPLYQFIPTNGPTNPGPQPPPGGGDNIDTRPPGPRPDDGGGGPLPPPGPGGNPTEPIPTPPINSGV